MVNAINAFLPKSVYESNKIGIKVARPDIIVPIPNGADSFFTINRSIAQINSRELLFLARSDSIDSPLLASPRFLKDVGARLNIPNHIDVEKTILSNRSATIPISAFIPETAGVDIISTEYTAGSLSKITIALANLPEGYSVQFEVLDPNTVVS